MRIRQDDGGKPGTGAADRAPRSSWLRLRLLTRERASRVHQHALQLFRAGDKRQREHALLQLRNDPTSRRRGSHRVGLAPFRDASTQTPRCELRPDRNVQAPCDGAGAAHAVSCDGRKTGWRPASALTAHSPEEAAERAKPLVCHHRAHRRERHDAPLRPVIRNGETPTGRCAAQERQGATDTAGAQDEVRMDFAGEHSLRVHSAVRRGCGAAAAAAHTHSLRWCASFYSLVY